MTWISVKVSGFVHFGVPCTMVVLECSKERWVTKTSPGFAALVLSECPWTTSTKCQNRPPSMAVGKTKPYKNTEIYCRAPTFWSFCVSFACKIALACEQKILIFFLKKFKFFKNCARFARAALLLYRSTFRVLFQSSYLCFWQKISMFCARHSRSNTTDIT